MFENNSTLQSHESRNSTQLYNAMYSSELTEVFSYFSLFLIVSALIKIVGNGFLLLVIYKDPHKVFRTPPTVFIASLSITGFSAGLTYEPVLATLGLLRNYKNIVLRTHAISTAVVLWKNSILIALAFTIAQLVAVTSPLRYARKITSKKILSANVIILCYSITTRAMVQYFSGSARQISIFFHFILIPFTTLAVYISLYRAFKRQVGQNKSLGCESGTEFQRRKRRRLCQQQYMTINLILILTTIVGTQATAIPSLLYDLNAYDEAPRVVLYLALSTAGFLSLKLVSDTIIFAWRFPQYRQALRTILLKRNISEPLNNKSVSITSFKTIKH